MTPQHAEALSRLRAANRTLFALRSALRDIPNNSAALAAVDLCLSALEQLYKDLAAQASGQAPPSS